MKTKTYTASNYTSNRTLESLIWLSAITLMLLLLSYNRLAAMDFDFAEEAYVDDIPFNTERIAEMMVAEGVQFEDENYIDDIPFNTAVIARQYRLEQALHENFEMEDEATIADIPFDTEKINAGYGQLEAMSVEYEMDDETYIDDIPFETELVNLCQTAGSGDTKNRVTL